MCVFCYNEMMEGETHEIIIPVDEVAYAAWRSPTQNDQPAGHPE